jgi:hypothetical protein
MEPAEIRISYDMEDRSPEFLRDLFRRKIRASVWRGSDGRWRAEDAAERKWIWNATGNKWVPGCGTSGQDGA